MLLARSYANLQREQDNKLMNFEAIVAAIGHEVKQPLGAIELNISSAQLILQRTPADVGELQAIMAETRDSARRIDETLDGFRSLVGKFDQKRQPVNLNEVILDVLKSSRTELERSPHLGTNGADNGAAGDPRQWKSTTSTHL